MDFTVDAGDEGGPPSAEAALYFAGDGSRYVTCTVLPVDGRTVAGTPVRAL